MHLVSKVTGIVGLVLFTSSPLGELGFVDTAGNSRNKTETRREYRSPLGLTPERGYQDEQGNFVLRYDLDRDGKDDVEERVFVDGEYEASIKEGYVERLSVRPSVNLKPQKFGFDSLYFEEVKPEYFD